MAVQPVIRLKFGEDTFDVVKLMASEVAKIKAWTGLASKKAWLTAIGADDIDAFRAGYALMKQRAGEDIRFSVADFDTDEMDAVFVDEQGREIAPSMVDDEPVFDAKGDLVWVYLDDGEAVPPTEA